MYVFSYTHEDGGAISVGYVTAVDIESACKFVENKVGESIITVTKMGWCWVDGFEEDDD